MPISKTVKYLGVHLDETLNFHKHVQESTNKSNSTIKTLYPLINKNSKLTINNKLLIYKQLIRPILTYAAPVWCHLKPTTTLPLQRI
ncbi:hypothetical protein BDFB_014245 [Asbolus verrucosus]|uniref:RVT 1 domain containing protein n=1 Tax=Asbolus verrucosus TaxID=1661398 RepID=A0A482VK71_ASBVE|nr:hypothetical protein BDFB_014245 [Asbolus verrucosus]